MERLQRIMAARGVASRRAAEDLIRAGRVTLDGELVTELGTKADPVRSVIRVDGKLLKTQRPRYILLNKPRGYITTVKDERDRRTVMDLVTVPERVFPVGRLDRDTEGLLLLTNDGDVANRVMHPRYGLDKEYQVLTLTRPSEALLKRLRDGVRVDGKLVVPDEVRIARETNEGLILKIVVHEGINHLVRRMMEEVGIPLERLRRVRLGPLSIAGVQVGVWRELTPGELENLLQAVQLDQPDDPEVAERTRRYSSAQAEARRGHAEPKAPRPNRDDTLLELPNDRAERRPPRRPDPDEPRRAPRGDRFAQMRHERRERRRLVEESRQDNPSAGRERQPGEYRDERDRRPEDVRPTRGFAQRERGESGAPRRFERDDRERGFRERRGDSAQPRSESPARPGYRERRDDDTPRDGFPARPGSRERGDDRFSRSERGSNRGGYRDEREFDQPRGGRGRGFERGAGDRDERPSFERASDARRERRDFGDQRGDYTPRRERGNARRHADDQSGRREEVGGERFARGYDRDRGRPDRFGERGDERAPRPRRSDEDRNGSHRPPVRAERREDRRERDEPQRPYPAGPRAPRRPFGDERTGPRRGFERRNDGPMNQRGARDDQERQTPPGDRDRRSGGGREDDRRPRPRRPPRRDLP